MDVDLTAFETGHFDFTERHSELFADPFGQFRVRGTRENTQLVAKHDTLLSD
jgi:hypothetical protein